MLFTITGNLLAEITAKFLFPKEGETVRAVGKSTFQVGGKGVNVAKAFFKISKEKPIAIIFPAGFSGNRAIQWLSDANFCEVKSFSIKGETRIGLVCENKTNAKQTTFLGEDVAVSKNAFSLALNSIKQNCKQGDFVAFCGSFPAWKDEYANALVKLCQDKKLKLCVDTYGKPLKAFAKKKIFLLKINKKEFQQTFGANALFEKNRCEHIVITNSKNKILAMSGSLKKTFIPPKIKSEISATGCGDVMLASLIAEINKGTTFWDALKLSIARSSASAEISETAAWNNSRAKELLKQIS